MRPLLALLAASLVAAAPPAPLGPAHRAALAELSRLASEASRAWDAGRRDDALAAWARRHEKVVALVGPAHALTLASVARRASWLLAAGRFADADAPLAENERIQAALRGPGHFLAREAALSRRETRELAGMDATRRAEVGKLMTRLKSARLDVNDGLPVSASTRAAYDKLASAAPDLLLACQGAFDLGAALSDAGRHGEAAVWLGRAAPVLEKRLGTHPRTAAALHLLGYSLQSLGRPAEASGWYRRALSMRLATLGPRDPETLWSLNNLANTRVSLGDHDGAVRLHQRCLALRVEAFGAGGIEEAHSLHNLGWTQQEAGRPAAAIPFYERALAIRRVRLGPRHPDYLLTLSNQANARAALHDFAKARVAHAHIVKVSQEVFGRRHVTTLSALHNVAHVEQEAGELAKAKLIYEEVLVGRRARLGERHPDTLQTLGNLSNLHVSLRDHEAGIAGHERVVRAVRARAGATALELASALHGLGYACQEGGQGEKARRAYEDALALVLRASGPGHRLYALTWSNLANLYMQEGDLHRAEALHRRALAAYRDALGPGHPSVARVLANLAIVSRIAGRLDEAGRLLGEAGAMDPPPLICDFHRHLAKLALFRGRRGDAILHAAASLHRMRRAMEPALGALSGRQRASFVSTISECIELLLSASHPGDPAAPLYEAVLSLKGFLASHTAEERELPDTPDVRELLDDLRLARGELAAAASRPDAEVGPVERRKESLEVRLARLSEGYRRLRAIRRPTASGVAAALPAGHALVEFVRYFHSTPLPLSVEPFFNEPRYIAFILRKGAPAVMVRLGAAAPIDAAVAAWRKKADESGVADADAARELRRRVWLPVEARLGGLKAVLIAPDGGLSGLPFAALPGGKPGRELLDEYAIGYLTSGRQLLDLSAVSHPERKGALLVGDPAFGSGWGGLPGSRAEVARVQALFRNRDGAASLLVGGEATRAALLASLTKAPPRWLHLATHGTFDPAGKEVLERNPLLSAGLVLAGGERLTAEEVSGLDLRGVELAALSACETGLGRLAGWQGVQGLQRGFHQAGARSVAASLWSVNDAATSLLMEQFYSRLWGEGRPSKAEAMRQAQLFVRDNPDAVLKRAEELKAAGVTDRGAGKTAMKLPPGKPHSPIAWWAAWVLSGDPGR